MLQKGTHRILSISSRDKASHIAEGILTKEETLEFQELAKVHMGLDLTFEEAEDQGSRLIQMFELFKTP
jgi:hypothetical protein